MVSRDRLVVRSTVVDEVQGIDVFPAQTIPAPGNEQVTTCESLTSAFQPPNLGDL